MGFIFGFSESHDTFDDADIHFALIAPDVIDSGRVKIKDSPAHVSFSITNRSTVPVEIDEVLSGCGCTVIDLPRKTIRPNETLERIHFCSGHFSVTPA